MLSRVQGHITMNHILPITTQKQVDDALTLNVAEGFALAYEQVSDLAAMLNAVQSEHEKMIEYLQKVYAIPESVFRDSKRLIRITGELIDQSLEFSQGQENQYKS